MLRIGAPSIRPKALRFPPSSTIATFSVTPSSLAFTTPHPPFSVLAQKKCCVSSPRWPLDLILPLDVHCALVRPNGRSAAPSPNRSVRAMTTVDVEDVTRDEPGFVRRDEHDAVGNLFGEAKST